MKKEINKNIPVMIDKVIKIKKDCNHLKKRNDLTEYGKGQLDMSRIISKGLGLRK